MVRGWLGRLRSQPGALRIRANRFNEKSLERLTPVEAGLTGSALISRVRAGDHDDSRKANPSGLTSCGVGSGSACDASSGRPYGDPFLDDDWPCVLLNEARRKAKPDYDPSESRKSHMLPSNHGRLKPFPCPPRGFPRGSRRSMEKEKPLLGVWQPIHVCSGAWGKPSRFPSPRCLPARRRGPNP